MEEQFKVGDLLISCTDDPKIFGGPIEPGFVMLVAMKEERWESLRMPKNAYEVIEIRQKMGEVLRDNLLRKRNGNSPVGFTTEQKWIKEDADLSACTGCKKMIMSPKYVLSIEMTMLGNKETIPTGTVLCQSCYDALKIEKNNA